MQLARQFQLFLLRESLVEAFQRFRVHVDERRGERDTAADVGQSARDQLQSHERRKRAAVLIEDAEAGGGTKAEAAVISGIAGDDDAGESHLRREGKRLPNEGGTDPLAPACRV